MLLKYTTHIKNKFLQKLNQKYYRIIKLRNIDTLKTQNTLNI